MKYRRFFGLILSGMLLLLATGTGLARGPQPPANRAPDGVDASPGATAPWFVETADGAPGAGSHVSVAIDAQGTTYISYYDAANKDLKMAKHVGSGGNCGTDNHWKCETVDNTGTDVGKYSSIAIDPTTNLPAIAYWNASPSELRLATAWSGGWEILSIEAVSGAYASLKIDGAGSAHIAYHRSLGNNSSLKYARRVGGGTGNCGGNNYQCDTIDSGGGTGRYASLDLDTSGQPQIAYYKSLNDGLWYAHPNASGNCGPGNDWGCYPISTSLGAGGYASLDLDSNDVPHVAYYETGKLMYAVLVGPGGNCGASNTWRCDEIDTMGTLVHTRDVSLAVDSAGLPIIAYHTYKQAGQFTVRGLQYARPAAALGFPSGNCGPQKLWECERIQDRGDAGDYLSIAVSPSGLATIAYLNSDYFGSLRVAYQRSQVFMPLVLR